MATDTTDQVNDATPENGRCRDICAWLIRILGGFAVLATLLPLVPVGNWMIRGWDFPRFQIAVLLTSLTAAEVVWIRRFRPHRAGMLWLSALAVAGVWQWSHVIRFTAVWPVEVVSSPQSREPDVRLLVVNLNFQNDAHSQVVAEIQAVDPDILILLEVDESWRRGLQPLEERYRYRHDEVRDEGLGMSVWSRQKVLSAETRFIVEDRRPSIWMVLLNEREEWNLVAVHPTPPGLKDATGEARRNSRVRDAELALIAGEIAEQSDRAWIVAGDFNDVAWSHTTRLFKRLSGLRDPRIGRSFMGTFHADYPLVRFPIDHVFVSDGFTIGELSRCRITGSDHFGVFAALHMSQSSPGTTPKPEGDDRPEAAEIITEGREDAEARGVASEELR